MSTTRPAGMAYCQTLQRNSGVNFGKSVKMTPGASISLTASSPLSDERPESVFWRGVLDILVIAEEGRGSVADTDGSDAAGWGRGGLIWHVGVEVGDLRERVPQKIIEWTQRIRRYASESRVYECGSRPLEHSIWTD
jgi:hypothetical protein